MATNLKFSTALRNALMDAITAYAGANALISIYTGTQPTDANTAVGSQVLLGTLTCGATLAGAAVGGVLTLNTISSDTSADATGTATWFRLLKSDGATVVLDGSVGTASADLILNTTSVVTAATITISSATITDGNG